MSTSYYTVANWNILKRNNWRVKYWRRAHDLPNSPIFSHFKIFPRTVYVHTYMQIYTYRHKTKTQINIILTCMYNNIYTYVYVHTDTHYSRSPRVTSPTASAKVFPCSSVTECDNSSYCIIITVRVCTYT